MKVSVIQCASGTYSDMLELTAKHHSRMCNRMGVRYSAHFGRFCDRGPNWDRFPLITASLELADAVIWMDADSVIVGEEDLAGMFNGVAHIGLSKYTDIAWKDWGSHFNGGVMAVRDTLHARRFLQRVWDIGELENPHGWVNQPAIQQAHEETGLIDEIDIRWNCPVWVFSATTMIKSFHSHKAAALPFIQNELAQL